MLMPLFLGRDTNRAGRRRMVQGHDGLYSKALVSFLSRCGARFARQAREFFDEGSGPSVAVSLSCFYGLR